MKISDNSEAASMKPFRLVKFFSFTGLAVFLVFTLALSWLISNHAKRVLLERSEAYAQVVAQNLSHQVFQQFVIPTVLSYGQIALRNPDQHRRLDTVVRNATHGMRIRSVTIFDSKENIISYSTEPDRIGQRGAGGAEYARAAQGESLSRLAYPATILNLLPGAEPVASQLLTYIPFIQYKGLDDKPDIIMGVIEVVQDLSEDMEAIISFQGSIILTSMLIMSALFWVLRVIVGRAERIMEQRAEERRRLERDLHQSEKLAGLGKMVASVAHEIKNPLGIIQSTAGILDKRLQSVAPGNEHLAAIIVAETGRLDNIVREFLEFARPQTPKRAPESLNEIARQALTFVTPELEQRGIRPVLELDDSIDPLILDRDQIYRVLLNILLNAIQAMPEGGTLTMRGRRQGQGRAAVTVIEIADTGIGIAADRRERIFNPFYTDKHRGTGLGLAIVKNIIDSHQGRIEVESEPGQGACFRLLFPAVT